MQRRRVGTETGRENPLPLGWGLSEQESLRWPREESNLRTRIRSPPLYPLSYGAEREDSLRRALPVDVFRGT